MDPNVALIVTTLATGAATALAETAGQAIKDGYNGLKGLVQKKLAKDPVGPALVDELAASPEETKPLLTKKLEQAGAGQDAQLVQAAQALAALLEKLPKTVGGNAVHASGKGAVAIGGSVSGSTIITGSHNVTGNGNVAGSQKAGRKGPRG
jgi:hypothetical protein